MAKENGKELKRFKLKNHGQQFESKQLGHIKSSVDKNIAKQARLGVDMDLQEPLSELVPPQSGLLARIYDS